MQGGVDDEAAVGVVLGGAVAETTLCGNVASRFARCARSRNFFAAFLWEFWLMSSMSPLCGRNFTKNGRFLAQRKRMVRASWKLFVTNMLVG